MSLVICPTRRVYISQFISGIYRPPGIRRRGSIQPPSLLNGGSPLGSPLFGNSPFSGGGYIPPPLRKVSAPMAAQSLMGQCRSPTIRNVFGGFPIPTTQNQKCEMRDAETQTISTGEIAVLKVRKLKKNKEILIIRAFFDPFFPFNGNFLKLF